MLDRSNGLLRVRILAYDDSPDDAGKVIFDERCDFRAFVAAVASGARRVLEEHGEAGYREKWVEHPFPRSTSARLKRLPYDRCFETNTSSARPYSSRRRWRTSVQRGRLLARSRTVEAAKVAASAWPAEGAR